MTTKYDRAVFGLIAAIPIFATILFGGVDTGTWAMLIPMTAIIVVCWCAHSIKCGTFTVSTSRLQIGLLGLILIGFIQQVPIPGIISQDPYNTRLFVIRSVCYLVFLAAALVTLNTERRLRIIAFGTVIFGALMAFAATLQRIASPDAIYGFRQPFQAIPFGPFVNQHHFAGFMEMTGALTTALLMSAATKREVRLLLALAAVIMAMACVLTSSRGGIACFIAGVVFVLLAMRSGNVENEPSSRQSYKRLGIALAAFSLLVVALVVFVGGDGSLLRGIGLQQAAGDITSGRLHFWSVSIKIFAANPIFGAGLDAFGVAFTQHDTWNGTFRVEQAHNEYLQLLAEGGVLALACAVGFVILLVRTSLRNIRKTSNSTLRAMAVGALGGCIAICLHSLVDFPLRTPSNAFFFLLMAAVATSTSRISTRSR